MGRGVGEIEHERIFLIVGGDDFGGFVGEFWKNVVEVHVGRDSSGTTHPALDSVPVFRQLSFDMTAWWLHCLISANVKVRRDVSGGTYAEVGIKATINRSTFQRLLVAVFSKSQVPFSNHSGGVAL